MGAIPYAFSVHHFISTVGADAGFAAIIGLAILILLYFGQARETASLREWADESAEHVRQLEARLAQLTRVEASSMASVRAPTTPPPGFVATSSAPAAAAARAGVGSPVGTRTAAPMSAPVPAGVPAAPAGVGAPALSAATRLIPSADREPISIRAGHASGAIVSEREVLQRGDTVVAAAGPPPATAAGGANGSSASRMPPPASAGLFSSQHPAQAPPRRSEIPGGGARPASAHPGRGPRRPGGPPSRTGPPSGGRSPIGRGVIVVLGLLGLIAVVVVVLVVTSGGTKAPASRASQFAATKSHRRRAGSATPTVTPSSVTVAVLNGTSTTNLAHTIAGRLTAAGFKEGTVATASDQTQTATVVGYLPHHRAAALAVAQSLKLGSASVQAVDQSNQTVACPASSTPCSAQVVVTVGSDLAPNT